MPTAVITRDVDDAARYVGALEAAGLTVIAMPVTRVVAVVEAERAELDAAVAWLAAGRYATLLVASSNGAHALAAAADRLGIDLATLPAIAAWTVGPTTAEALVRHGLRDVRVGGHSAEAAAQALIDAGDAGGRILLPRAAGGRDEALLALRAAGANVDDVTAYRSSATAPADPRLAAGLAAFRAGQVDVCAVFAPSQAQALAALLGADFPHAGCGFAAIGETTAAMLRSLGASRVAAATAPAPEALATAIAAVYPPPR